MRRACRIFTHQCRDSCACGARRILFADPLCWHEGNDFDCSHLGAQFSAQFMTAVLSRALVVEAQAAMWQRDR